MRRILAAAAVSILALSTPLLAQPLQPQTPLPMPQATAPAPVAGEWGSFGIQTQWIDTAAKPGDDFNRYVSGKWIAVTQIPADKTRIGSFITLRDLSEDRLHAILNELVASNPAPGSS